MATNIRSLNFFSAERRPRFDSTSDWQDFEAVLRLSRSLADKWENICSRTKSWFCCKKRAGKGDAFSWAVMLIYCSVVLNQRLNGCKVFEAAAGCLIIAFDKRKQTLSWKLDRKMQSLRILLSSNMICGYFFQYSHTFRVFGIRSRVRRGVRE